MAVLPGGGQGALQTRGQRDGDGIGRRLRPGAALEGDSTPFVDADQLHSAAVLQKKSGIFTSSDGLRADVRFSSKCNGHIVLLGH